MLYNMITHHSKVYCVIKSLIAPSTFHFMMENENLLHADFFRGIIVTVCAVSDIGYSLLLGF